MILTYTGEGQEPQTWAVTLTKLMAPEAEAIEDRTGWDFEGEYPKRLLGGNIKARRALLWILQKRDHPTLRYDQVTFASGEVVLSFERDELERMREALLKQPETDEFTERDRAELLGSIDESIAELPEVPTAPKVESEPEGSSI